MAGMLKVREQVRWWNRGQAVHFGGTGRDDEIAVEHYEHLPGILHDIDPDIDASRRVLAEQVMRAENYVVLDIAPLAPNVTDGQNSDFQTEGGVLVLMEEGSNVSESLAAGLRSRLRTYLDR